MLAPNDNGLDAAAAAPNAAAVLESMPNNVVDLLPVLSPPPNEKDVDGIGVPPSSLTMPVAVGTLTEDKKPPPAEGADVDVFAVEAAEPNTPAALAVVPPVLAVPPAPPPDPAQLSAFLLAPKSILMAAAAADDDDGGDTEKENAAGAGAGAALVWFVSSPADFTTFSFAQPLLLVLVPASLRAAGTGAGASLRGDRNDDRGGGGGRGGARGETTPIPSPPSATGRSLLREASQFSRARRMRCSEARLGAGAGAPSPAEEAEGDRTTTSAIGGAISFGSDFDALAVSEDRPILRTPQSGGCGAYRSSVGLVGRHLEHKMCWHGRYHPYPRCVLFLFIHFSVWPATGHHDLC